MIQFKRYFDFDLNDDAQKKMMNAFGSLVYEKERGVSGYYNLPYDSVNLLKEIKNYMVNEDGVYKSAKNIVVIGIGGSSLGTKAINSMLKHKYKNIKNLIFLENPDPVTTFENLSEIKKKILYLQ